jgi:hypothetical protein
VQLPPRLPSFSRDRGSDIVESVFGILCLEGVAGSRALWDVVFRGRGSKGHGSWLGAADRTPEVEIVLVEQHGMDCGLCGGEHRTVCIV